MHCPTTTLVSIQVDEWQVDQEQQEDDECTQRVAAEAS